jgi:hypothetical protein
MKKKSIDRAPFVTRRTIVALIICGAISSLLAGSLFAFLRGDAASKSAPRTLTFAQRVAYQRAIEDVYWRHRIWPRSSGDRPDPKPPVDSVMSQAQLEKKVADSLRNSQALEDYWQRPISAEQLQAEMDRMAKHTKQPDVLRELFEVLGNDPFLIAECLARPVLSERLITSFAQQQRRVRLALSEVQAKSQTQKVILANATYALPTISDASTGCTPDTWITTSTANAPSAREAHTAVWTGSEMIVWGGYDGSSDVNTGARYHPSTDSWTATSTTNAPTGRDLHTAVWTGSEMVIWGGNDLGAILNTGGRYNPTTDSWTPTSATNAPDARADHTAVWTGSEMIVWAELWASSSITPAGDIIPVRTRGQPPAPPTRLVADHGTLQCGPAVKWSSGADFVVVTLAADTILTPTRGQPPAPLTRPMPGGFIPQCGPGV